MKNWFIVICLQILGYFWCSVLTIVAFSSNKKWTICQVFFLNPSLYILMRIYKLIYSWSSRLCVLLSFIGSKMPMNARNVNILFLVLGNKTWELNPQFPIFLQHCLIKKTLKVFPAQIFQWRCYFGFFSQNT